MATTFDSTYAEPRQALVDFTTYGQSVGKTIPYLRGPITLPFGWYYDDVYSSSAIIQGQIVPQTRRGYYEETTYFNTVSPGIPPGQSRAAYGMDGDLSGNTPEHQQRVANAAANPWSPVHSPIPWLIGFFIVGILLITQVHWRYD